ncbi:MAG TPA: thioesterase family protein [Castellaniella sp.]|uniref:acyl-CoA thioesterase n=1 Tax=Castellaniella sp. TaxID=1955812 RepID=UPI002F1DDC9F
MDGDAQTFEVPEGVFQVRQEVRWGDLDALHHVNNTVYFRYFEEARVQLFTALDGTAFARRPVVLAQASCDFLIPLLYPASIVVGLKLVRVGRSSLELECWIADPADVTKVYARGRSVLVCIDEHTHRSVAWPPEQLQVLQRCFSA